MAGWTGLWFVLMCSIVHGVSATGRMLVPPQRSSLWRDPIQKYNPRVAKNFEDHRLNCGGLWRKKQNDGRCGVCGDPWDVPEPRPNEAKGVFAQGVIGRTYFPSDRFIPVKIEILSNIDGYFEFKICPNNDVSRKVTQACLDKNPINIYSEDRWTSYGTRFYPDLAPVTPGNISFALEIPNGITCRQCVLQWKWHGGNNWGKCQNGTSATGCGPQVEFYNCADIAILGTKDSVPVNIPGNAPGSRRTDQPALGDVVRKVLQANGMSISMGNSAASFPSKVAATLRQSLGGRNALNGQNVKPSALVNGLPKTSTRNASPLDILRRNRLSNKNPPSSGSMEVREPITPLLASMFGGGNGINSANMAPTFSKPIMQQSGQAMPFASGRNSQSAAALPLNTLIGGQPFNKQTTNPKPGSNSPLEAHLLEWALNPNNKAAEFFTMSLLLPLLRNDLRMSMLAMNRLAMDNMVSGSTVDSLFGFLQLLHNVSEGNQSQNRSLNDLLLTLGGLSPRRGGLNLPIVERMMNLRGMGSNFTGNLSLGSGNWTSTLISSRGEQGMVGEGPTASIFERNFATSPQFSQLASMLGSGSRPGVPDMSLNPELLMLSSLLRRRSGGSGGGETGEGARSSRVNPLMLLNPELSMISSLLGRGTQGGGEGSEGSQHSAGTHGALMSREMQALSSLFGRSSHAGGIGSEGGLGSRGFGLASLFGRNAGVGSEAADGGRSSSRMGLGSLFGGRSTAGGEAAEGGRDSRGMGLTSLFGGSSRGSGEGTEGGRSSGEMSPISMMPLVLLGSTSGLRGRGSASGLGLAGGNPFGSNPELMLMSSFIGRGSRRSGEATEGGEGGGGGMSGTSSLPLLAMMLGGGFGTGSGGPSQMGGNIAPAVPPHGMQSQGLGGVGLPEIQSMKAPPMLTAVSSSQNAPPLLNAALKRRSAMRHPPLTPNPVMTAMRPALMPNPVMTAMRPALMPNPVMTAMRPALMPNTVMNAMHSGRFAPTGAPTVSLLDMYRLSGGLAGRRRSRMVD